MQALYVAFATAVAAATATLMTAERGQAVSPPTLGELQAAYEMEASGANAEKHDAGLKLWDSTCRPANGKSFACSVSFFTASDPQQTLFMDIALVEPVRGGWILKSGLCRK